MGICITFLLDQVDRQLFSQCPQQSGDGGGREGVFVLNTAAQEAVIALGIYLIESGYKHLERWIPCVYIFKSENKITFLESWITYWGFIEVSPVPHFLMNLPGTVLQGLLVVTQKKRSVYFFKIPRYFCRIPPAETFAFSLTTLLNDVAAHKPEVVNSCEYLVFNLKMPFSGG